MNNAIIESWWFSLRNLRELFLFSLPFIVISILLEFGVILESSDESLVGNIWKLQAAIEFVLYPFYAGGILYLVSQISDGKSIGFKNIIKRISPLWFSLFFVSLFAGILITFGFMLLIIPGIWLLIRLFFSQLYVIFSNQKATEAINTSFRITKTNFLKIAFSIIPIFVLIMIIEFGSIYLLESINIHYSPASHLFSALCFIYLSVLQYRLFMLYGEETGNP